MKRSALGVAAAFAIASSSGVGAQKPETPVAVKVYVTPACGCCGKWVDHMKAAGFAVTREVTADLESVPARKGVPDRLKTCHTAVVGNYLVEGHVPPDLVWKLVREKPKIAGIAVPGMPAGSPGMESPYPQPYVIVAFTKDGVMSEYARR
jgi:hypothetical protein